MTNKKGITPVIAIVILLIIAVAVVGLAYGFISGIFSTVTGKAVIVSGKASCTGGLATITITNVGSMDLTAADLSGNIRRTDGGTSTYEDLDPKTVEIGKSGTVTETTTSNCGTGTCQYEVTIGGVSHPARADC